MKHTTQMTMYVIAHKTSNGYKMFVRQSVYDNLIWTDNPLDALSSDNEQELNDLLNNLWRSYKEELDKAYVMLVNLDITIKSAFHKIKQ